MNKTFNDNVDIQGNLNVARTITANDIRAMSQDKIVFDTNGRDNTISFNKSCHFSKPIVINGGLSQYTTIGKEGTYNSAYVGTSTVQAGQRLIVGDSNFKIEDSEKKIYADTYKMMLKKLVVDSIESCKLKSLSINSDNIKVKEELVADSVFANKIRGNDFFIGSIQGINLTTAGDFITKSLHVTSQSVMNGGLTINGTISNGGALTVNDGTIVANRGILSNTKNNRFQCLEITGGDFEGIDESGVYFRVDQKVDSIFEGNVTIKDSKLILDNSSCFSDKFVVTNLKEMCDSPDGQTSSSLLITSTNKQNDIDNAIDELPEQRTFDIGEEYNHQTVIDDALTRNKNNYWANNMQLRSIISPVTYMNSQVSQAKPFGLKSNNHIIDSNGNALLKNIVSEKGRFNDLDVYNLNVNKIYLDKFYGTSVASNVVDTDKLLKSRGIAEFDGAVHSKADIFIEKDSSMTIDEGTKVNFKNGSELVIADGAKLTIGQNSTLNLESKTVMDLSKLIFKQGNRQFKIEFRDASPCDGGGLIMEYHEVQDNQEPSEQEIVTRTANSAKELSRKLKSLGI